MSAVLDPIAVLAAKAPARHTHPDVLASLAVLHIAVLSPQELWETIDPASRYMWLRLSGDEHCGVAADFPMEMGDPDDYWHAVPVDVQRRLKRSLRMAIDFLSFAADNLRRR